MTNLERGNLTVSDDVVAAYVNEAVLTTDGVNDLYAGFSETLSKNILGKYSIYKGLKITTDEEGYSIDVYLIADYGVRIPELAWNVQKNVISELESVMTIKVKDVNIHIQGVALPIKDKETSNNEKE
jgi:uncharacterized alkaline shock family protein YloU